MTLDELKRLRDENAKYPESGNRLLVALADYVIKQQTNQGGGGDASAGKPVDRVAVTGEASSSREQSGWTPDSAAAFFEERIQRLVEEVYTKHSTDDLIDHRGGREELAARLLRLEDSLFAARQALFDQAAAKDAEIARLTKERNAAYTELKRCITDRDALKAALDEERRQAGPMVAACRSIAESFRSSIAFNNGLDVHVVSAQDAQRMIAVVDSFDARRSASRAKEGA